MVFSLIGKVCFATYEPMGMKRMILWIGAAVLVLLHGNFSRASSGAENGPWWISYASRLKRIPPGCLSTEGSLRGEKRKFEFRVMRFCKTTKFPPQVQHQRNRSCFGRGKRGDSVFHRTVVTTMDWTKSWYSVFLRP